MNLRRILIFVGLIGLIILAVSAFGNPHQTIAAFRRVRWYVVPLVIAIQILSYFSIAKYYQTFFRISGHRVKLRRLYEASLAINFANQAIPSGGVAATTYLSQAVKPDDVPAGKATLAQLGRYIFTLLSYLLVLAFGFVALFFGNDLGKVSVRVVVFVVIIILAGGSVLLTVLSQRSRLEAFIHPVIRLINLLGRKLFRRRQTIIKPSRLENFLNEFYRGYHEIMSHKRRWPALLWWTLGGNLAEILTIYAVFVSFGQWVNPGVIIIGYTLAVAVSAGGVVVNGLGVYEAGMVGTFAALGVPFALGLAVVIVYRLLSFTLFLPLGLYFYRHHLKEVS